MKLQKRKQVNNEDPEFIKQQDKVKNIIDGMNKR